MTTVPRPRSSPLVPTTVSGARPVPIGTSTHDDSSTTVPGTRIPPPEPPAERERWRVALDEYLARKARTAELRRDLAAARAAGKARRHADRLARLNRAAVGPSEQDRDHP